MKLNLQKNIEAENGRIGELSPFPRFFRSQFHFIIFRKPVYFQYKRLYKR